MSMELTGKTMIPLQLSVMQATSLADNYVKVGFDVASDAVEAGTTDTIITATAHVAVVGDEIVMTSGGEDGEGREVTAITANTITLEAALSGTPTATETFNIIRPVKSKQVKILRIANTSDAALRFSVDGTIDHDQIGATDTVLYDLRSNNLRLGAQNTIIKLGAGTDPNQFLYVKVESSAATTGSLFITMFQ